MEEVIAAQDLAERIAAMLTKLIRSAEARFDYLGEFFVGSGGLNRIVWADEDEWLTDLGTVPVRKGSVVSVYEGDDAELADVVEVIVADVRRV
jgi:hypothetical protein